MELKVHIDKTVRIVCGLNKDTTVQDVIIALAHSLKQTGRFYLIEKSVNSPPQNHTSPNPSTSTSRKVRREKKQQYSNANAHSNARVMSPNEKPIELLGQLATNTPNSKQTNKDIEFHLIRSTSDRPEQVASELIEQINELNQQHPKTRPATSTTITTTTTTRAYAYFNENVPPSNEHASPSNENVLPSNEHDMLSSQAWVMQHRQICKCISFWTANTMS